MILSKDSNNNWTPTAGGTGTFIGTLAAFNAIKDTLPNNTVAYITDDGNGDLQPVDAVTNGDMHPVTSNAVYDITNPNSVSNPITRNTTYTSAIGEILSYKVGRIAQLHAYISLQNVPLNTIVNVANVADSIKPITMTELCIVENLPTNQQYVRFWIDTAGLISVFITDSASQNVDFRVQATYITAE